MCCSIKYPYSPHRRSLEIPRGRGVLIAKLLEEKYEAALEFAVGAGVRGVKQKACGEGVWIFSGVHIVTE